MKCPYRSFVVERVDHGTTVETQHHEYFENCYEDECPYYALADDNTAVCNKAYADLTSYVVE